MIIAEMAKVAGFNLVNKENPNHGPAVRRLRRTRGPARRAMNKK